MHFIIFVVLVAFGIFLFVYGGHDDSPGAQGIGLLVVIFGVWRLYVHRRSSRKHPTQSV